MALVNCNECKKEISGDAKVCPHCGYTGNIKDRKKAEQDAFDASPAGKITKAVFVILIGWGLYALAKSCSENQNKQNERMAAYEICKLKGHAYFKEIGSWPRLSDGRDAEVVAAERCSNTTGAFDGTPN